MLFWQVGSVSFKDFSQEMAAKGGILAIIGFSEKKSIDEN